MKRTVLIVLTAILLIALFPVGVFANGQSDISEFTLPKPAAPVYTVFEGADRTATEGDDALYVFRQTDLSVLELSAEENSDRDAFLEKYGLYDFRIIMQYDTSLDGTDNWNYTPEWDCNYNAPSAYEACPIAWIGSEAIEKVTIFDLYAKAPDNDNYSKMLDAIIQRDVPDGDYTFNNFYFDYENHRLYMRVRYYMEWETYDGETIGELQSKYSEWSDVAIWGKDGTTITPETPSGYEAPVISELKYVPPEAGSELGSLTYMQETPEQVWNAGMYYEITGDGQFDGLETEISLDSGEWLPYTTADSWGDWCLWNGVRTAFYEEPRIETDSNIKLRVRFLGTHGPSEWSNTIELNGGGTQEVSNETDPPSTDVPVNTNPEGNDKCSICGFCSDPLGICIFIWLAIILAVIIIIVAVVIIIVKSKKKKSK